MSIDVPFFLLGLNGGSDHTLPNGTEPLIFLDFVNEEYESNGSTVLLGALLTENGDWGAWVPGTAVVHGTGLVGSANANPVLTGDAFDLAADGATILLEFGLVQDGTANSLRYEMVDDLNDYNTYYGSGIVGDNELEAVSTIYDNSTTTNDLTVAEGVHKAAFTMIDGKISRSVNGAAIKTINPADPWTPPPLVMGFIVPPHFVMRSVGIYPAQPDADLPMLSAP